MDRETQSNSIYGAGEAYFPNFHKVLREKHTKHPHENGRGVLPASGVNMSPY